MPSFKPKNTKKFVVCHKTNTTLDGKHKELLEEFKKDSNEVVPRLRRQMKKIINEHSAGMVATVNENGTPSVSPKATFFIINEKTISFGNIRSPNTIKNILKRPNVEINFIDVLHRKALRVTGLATYDLKKSFNKKYIKLFNKKFSNYLSKVSGFVKIKISSVELILSPLYDDNEISEREVKKIYLEKFNNL